MRTRTSSVWRAVAICVALVSMPASSGFNTGQSVLIDDAHQFANGDLGFVYNTADNEQHIGCANFGGVGFCQAHNLAGTNRMCATSNPRLLAVMRSLSGDSHLQFHWMLSGDCTQITVSNSSMTAPKRLSL